jgi:hypothetical protein
MAYNSPTAAELRANAEGRYAATRGRLMNLLAARQQYANQLHAQEQARLAEQEAELEAQRNEGQRNWLNMAGQGAMVGSVGGPWGALIGGAVGAGVGLAGSAANRQKENGGGFGGFMKGVGQSFVKPVGDKWDGMSDIPVAGIAAGAASVTRNSPAKGVTGEDAAAMNAQFEQERFARTGRAGYMTPDNPLSADYQPRSAIGDYGLQDPSAISVRNG